MPVRITKRTAKVEHVGKEGLIKDGDKTIHSDEWLHPEIFNEDEEKSSDRHIRTLMNSLRPKKKTEKSLDLIIDLPIPLELYLDLHKANLDTTKLVRRPVQVHGKNGKIFTRMMWVDPNTGLPAKHGSAHTESSDEVHHTMTRKEFIDKKVKDMSTEEKYKMLEKHKIPHVHNDHEAIAHKNKIVALKDHLYKNPHLVGAEHLPEDTNHTPDGTHKINDWTNKFKNDPEKLYHIMRKHGIADVDPRGNPEDKAAPIKHMHNMQKLKAFLKDNPHIMEDPEHQPDGNKAPVAPTQPPKSRAQAGGNDIQGVLKTMSGDELYTLMRAHGIAQTDPRLDTTDKSAPIKHMHNMMKLKALIEKNPDLLKQLGVAEKPDDGQDGGKPNGAGSDLGSHNDETSKIIGDMSKELKMKLIKQYADHPIMKDNHTRHSNANIDYMHGVTALKKLFASEPNLLEKHKGEADNEHLMSYKIGNKAMAKVLRAALGLKGVGDVKMVEDGVEWKFETGFVRREKDDTGEPILSVVETGKDDTEWNEFVIPVKDAVGILEGSNKEPEVKPLPLHESTMENIANKLEEDFDANYTPKVGERLKDQIGSIYNGLNSSMLVVSQYASPMGLSVGTMAKAFEKWGVNTTEIGGRTMVARSGLDNFKRIAYKDMISSSKGSKNANDFIYRKGDFADVFPLHESAKHWNDEEKRQARVDLLHASIHVPDEDKLADHGHRHAQLAEHLHESLKHVPFDLLSHMMADGYKMKFTKVDHRGNPHLGNHYLDNQKVIEFNHAYYSDNSINEGHPMDHRPADRSHPTIPNATYGSHPFSDTASHEFAHAIDNFLSGNSGFLDWQTSANGQKYVPAGHRNCVPDSYHKAVESTNPDKLMGRSGNGNNEFLYHKDNWISTYEARIYDRRYYHPTTRADHVGFDSFKQSAYDKSYDKNEVGKVGVEHWSENVSRYTNAKLAHEKYLRSGGTEDIDDWAQSMHEDVKNRGYHSEEDPLLSTSTAKLFSGHKSYRHFARIRPDKTAGFLWHEMKLKHPDLHNSIKTILDREDFIK